MKITILTFILFLFPFVIFAQSENIDSGKYHPAKEIFETKYEKQEYSKFASSQIRIFPGKVILMDIRSIEYPESTEKKYKLIFENGLINPCEINGNYNIKICCIDELPLLNPNAQTKRYKFWIFPKDNQNVNASAFQKILSNTVNPNEYYFELKNQNANENTSDKDFINGAKLTYLTFGTIII